MFRKKKLCSGENGANAGQEHVWTILPILIQNCFSISNYILKDFARGPSFWSSSNKKKKKKILKDWKNSFIQKRIKK
jgi:hypothetical protein